MYLQNEKITEAITAYERCLASASSNADSSVACSALLALGRVYAAWDSKRAVVRYFEPALLRARAAGDRPSEAAALLGLAGSPATLTELDPGQYAEMALAIYADIGDGEKAAEARELAWKHSVGRPTTRQDD